MSSGQFHGSSSSMRLAWVVRQALKDVREPGARIDELTCFDQGIVVAFRRHTLLPLDDCLSDVCVRENSGVPPPLDWRRTGTCAASEGCAGGAEWR